MSRSLLPAFADAMIALLAISVLWPATPFSGWARDTVTTCWSSLVDVKELSQRRRTW